MAIPKADKLGVDVVEAPSMMQLLRQLNDPAVRRGLSMTLNIVKSVSDQN